MVKRKKSNVVPAEEPKPRNVTDLVRRSAKALEDCAPFIANAGHAALYLNVEALIKELRAVLGELDE